MNEDLSEGWATRHLLITQRLRQRRADLGLTQKQVVSRLARAGVRTTNRAVSSLEHGAGLDVARLPELAMALDCTVTYLVGLTADPHRWEPDADHLPHLAPRRGPRSVGSVGPSVARTVNSAPRDESAPAGSLIIGAVVPQRDLGL